jgi:hypothetical protein
LRVFIAILADFAEYPTLCASPADVITLSYKAGTLAAYATGEKHYERFCALFNITPCLSLSVLQCSLDASPFDAEVLTSSLKSFEVQDPIRATRPKRPPILFWTLDRCRPHICGSNPLETVAFNAMVVGVYGLCRASEIVANPPLRCVSAPQAHHNPP